MCEKLFYALLLSQHLLSASCVTALSWIILGWKSEGSAIAQSHFFGLPFPSTQLQWGPGGILPPQTLFAPSYCPSFSPTSRGRSAAGCVMITSTVAFSLSLREAYNEKYTLLRPVKHIHADIKPKQTSHNNALITCDFVFYLILK